MQGLDNARYLISASALSLVALFAFSPAPAHARDGFGFGIGSAILNEVSRAARSGSSGGGGRSHSRTRERDSDDGGRSSTSSSGSKSSDKTADDRAADQRNFYRKQEEEQEKRKTERLEVARNVDRAVREFIAELKRQHDNLHSSRNSRSTAASSANQVTEGEVKQAIEAAYTTARLDDFGKIPGELWTHDRLLVRILTQSKRELNDYFLGVGVKGTSMDDLKQVFAKSAQHVYRQALQVAELIGVSYSYDRLVRTAFEHSTGAGDEASLGISGGDGRYERLISRAIEAGARDFDVSGFGQSASAQALDQQFSYRFRSRRVLYDCMSSRYEEVTRSPAKPIDGSGAMNIAERGARLGGALPASGPRADRPGTAAPIAEASGALWPSMVSLVNDSCSRSLTKVAGEAKAVQIYPMPSRWDSSGNDPLFSGGLAPVGLPGAPGQPGPKY